MHIIIFNYFLFSDTASANNMDYKQWYHFDDSIVSETREDRLVVSFLNTCSAPHTDTHDIPNTHAQTAAACILFYRRRDHVSLHSI